MTPPVPPLSQVERLLIVKTSSIGDVIHALPIVQAIKTANSGLTLDWVVRRRCADVLRDCPWIDHLFVVPDKPSLRDIGKLRQSLHVRRYQCALDMQGLFLSGLITGLSGAPVRIGWDRNREGNALWLTHPIVPGRASDARGDRHEVDALYGFAEVLGVQEPHAEFTPQPYLAAEGAAQAAKWLQSLGRPKLVLNVGASRTYKRWPMENWAVLADSLIDQKYGIVFVGDQRDAQTVVKVREHMTHTEGVVDLSGKTALRQLASVLADCNLVVSGDSGPVHLAVAVGTPVVALFGATNSARHGPYGARNTVVQKAAPSAHGSHRPTDEQGESAMKAITPADVLSAVQAQFDKTQHDAT